MLVEGRNAFFENFPEESTNQNNVSTLDATLNMTHITDLYYAVTGNSHFCSKYPHIGQKIEDKTSGFS
jgi:hypothetical protein